MREFKTNGLQALLTILLLTSCKKLDVPDGTPKCLTDKIEELKKQDCPSVETVYQYDFQGQTVYVFNPKNCGNDLASEVTDKDCNNLCWLWGISGNKICNGDDFTVEATNEKLIWEND